MQRIMTANPVRVIVFGAHPDDPDSKAGGVAALYSRLGHKVKMVSLTNGDAGHQERGGAPLAWERRKEAAASGKTLGCEYIALDNHDGGLLPSLEVRAQVIAQIRAFAPDIVMLPRPWDYHPDHRYTGQVVQDALYMVTVPNVVSEVPHLRKNPIAMYLLDNFKKPYPFTPDVVVGIDAVIKTKLDALHCHTSQMYEWLAYNAGILDQVPADPVARRAWLGQTRGPANARTADLYRAKLIELYGEERGRKIKYAEAFEVCEFGAPLKPEDIKRLFPFFD
jgi:N-acetylglucosamine malate deacetylase 1